MNNKQSPKPKISILMPVYNGLPLVKASVESVLYQTYSNWECIVVDDGSNDGTSDFLDSINDPRFIIHHFSSNQGRPIARQKTLELASGDYISMLDAEDIYAKNALEVLINKMEEDNDVVLVSANMCSFGTKTDILRKRGVDSEKKIFFNGKVFPNHASSIMLTARAKKFQYNPLMRLGQDRDFLEQYLDCMNFVLIPNILYYYSEFDSVTKPKIRKTYKLFFLKYLKRRDTLKSLNFLIKYFITFIFYPFVSTEWILKRRGKPLTIDEHKQFEVECFNLVNKYTNQ